MLDGRAGIHHVTAMPQTSSQAPVRFPPTIPAAKSHFRFKSNGPAQSRVFLGKNVCYTWQDRRRPQRFLELAPVWPVVRGRALQLAWVVAVVISKSNSLRFHGCKSALVVSFKLTASAGRSSSRPTNACQPWKARRRRGVPGTLPGSGLG